MLPHITRLLRAVYRGRHRASPSQPASVPSPAPNAETIPEEYEDVAKADAIAELSFSTGDPQTDGLHAALIDCVQAGYLKTVRGKDDGLLRFGVTSAGKARIKEYLSEME